MAHSLIHAEGGLAVLGRWADRLVPRDVEPERPPIAPAPVSAGVGGFGRLPIRVRVLSSWWNGHGWLSPPRAEHVIGDDRLYVFSPSVPIADAVLVFGELVSEVDAALRGGYSLMDAIEEAERRGCHLAIGVAWQANAVACSR